VSSRPNAQPEEQDPVDEGAEDEGRSGREGERQILQHHSAADLDEAGMGGGVKEKVDAPTPTTSDDDMDLLDNDEAPLIKDGSPPPTGMDINMVFTLPTEFRVVEQEVAQMCLGPKEAMFEKPEESS
jgi:hypothetical protein